MNQIKLRTALPKDEDFIVSLEQLSFPKEKQSTKKSIQNSINSKNQIVYIAEIKGIPAGSAILFLYKHSLRIYSIAVHPDFQKKGLGKFLLNKISKTAQEKGFKKITLEVESKNEQLVKWYQKFSFEKTEFLKNYYGTDKTGFRMEKNISCRYEDSEEAGNIIVVDNPKKYSLDFPGIKIISAKDYLSLKLFRNSEKINVLNLCSNYKAHSMGYYISLISSARNHRVIPSVMTVKDITNISIAQTLFEEIRDVFDEKLKSLKNQYFEIIVILGKTPTKEYNNLAKKLFSIFEIPFFQIVFTKKESWKIKKVSLLNIDNALNEYPELFKEALSDYFDKKRYRKTRLKNYKYDLAILVNPEEKTPPSCEKALNKFKKAAEKTGFYTEFITKTDYRRLCEFDALFIRETTAIENHTYQIARHAYTEGLVVIDDPWSILLCSNKVYLNERLDRAGIKQPRSWLLTKKMLHTSITESLPFPIVLKLPESSFSLGVFKVKSPEELKSKLSSLLLKSDLVIAQEYLQTDYDWRIGVLDNQPLFACKYFMAQGHWQIYNWESQENPDFSGMTEAVPINQVPSKILKAAVKSSSLIGNGLYGVDIKEIKGSPVIIEINDNPNIDSGIEDQLLGEELYLRIMNSFFNRIEKERQNPNFLL
ncbi:MAG: GNAT family N-acetyltransferase [Desulforegulaceae bacterium]|nr:GNAT family N-acetyltransferase [Desulforegulaceae bacterium]